MNRKDKRSYSEDEQQRRTAQEIAVPVVEEELQVGKRLEERGGVRVRRDVQETPVEETVRLQEERINVERRPVDRPVTEQDFETMQPGQFEIREHAEVPVVAKQAHVIEEVIIGKEMTEREETIRDTVRRADVEIEDLRGMATDTATTGAMTSGATTSAMASGGAEDIPGDLVRLRDLDNFEVAEGQPDIRGWNLYDRNHDKIGKVKYLLASPSTHKAYFAVVDSGGWLSGEELHAVPLSQVSFDESDNEVRSSFLKEEFERAPAYRDGDRDYNRYNDYWRQYTNPRPNMRY